MTNNAPQRRRERGGILGSGLRRNDGFSFLCVLCASAVRVFYLWPVVLGVALAAILKAGQGNLTSEGGKL